MPGVSQKHGDYVMHRKQHGTSIKRSTRIKWLLFYVIEKISLLRQRLQQKTPISQRDWLFPPCSVEKPESREVLWVFVSTIGELNLVRQYLDGLVEMLGNPCLVLITDHEHYRDSYHQQYPNAYIAVIDGSSVRMRTLGRAFPPRWLQITEIPCFLSDAPCRFPFSAIYEAKRKGAMVYVVNGWIYGAAPTCRIDVIEKKLFDRDYLQLVDFFLVQNDLVKEKLALAGVNSGVIHVAGNLKFDAVSSSELVYGDEKSPEWLRVIDGSSRPCIVAGCLSDIKEQEVVLNTFKKLLLEVPDALLVIVPRHPEFLDRMELLREFIESRDFSFNFKTKMKNPDIDGLQVIVVDTVGELKAFYAVCDVAFVGIDHNILEPVMYGKPVTLMDGWESIYPSYPIFSLLKEKNVLSPAGNEKDLLLEWLRLLTENNNRKETTATLLEVISKEKGACGRSLTYTSNYFRRVSH